ncbi:hypothetical protein PBR20603_00208 [Pandoraea bronchicola]|uniref:Uncharacterized protein n=2 Tax=Pandoraea bronchicola TaxID=2508287 RepID=A0A5E5BKA0_9BURK|nr:hypothetical protein PBR20603_00208 [Pandoraea bronchicola]
MRRGASGKQYLFLHISCLILQVSETTRGCWGAEWPESTVGYGGKMADASGAVRRLADADAWILPDSPGFLPDRAYANLEDQANSRGKRMLCDIAAVVRVMAVLN